MDELRYPIGTFQKESDLSDRRRGELIEQVAELPARLRSAVGDLSSEQLDTRYRPGGWTVRQLVHHLADSHLNAYIRFKLALTEENPTIKTYQEKLWAELADGRNADPEISLALVESLHQRWIAQLQALSEDDFGRTLLHPEVGLMSLDDLLCLYAWHGRHHVAQITSLRKREAW